MSVVIGDNSSQAMLNIRNSAPALLQKIQNGLSRPPVELIYISHPRWPFLSPEIMPEEGRRSLRISILDSSFNPPTLAHLALANSHRPIEWAEDANGPDYDAKLLLLSVKNADKSLKTGDATYLQRLEMMSLLTKSMTSHFSKPLKPSDLQDQANVAIAIVDEPTFVGKSDALLAFLKHRFTTTLSQTQPNVELTFLVGLDTLERLFSPRYYPSEIAMMASLRKFFASEHEGGDNSRIVCAKRVFAPSATLQSSGESEEAKALALSKEFEDAGRIAVIDIGDTLSTYSSSAVRGSIGRDGLDAKGKGGPVWKNFVTPDVAAYIVHERLYEHIG